MTEAGDMWQGVGSCSRGGGMWQGVDMKKYDKCQKVKDVGYE